MAATMTSEEARVDRPGGRLVSVQALRGVAAFLVVVAHAIEHAPGRSGDAILLTGRFGVEIFFVISGVVILLAAGAGTFSPVKFMARRIWRVVPLYWLTTALFAVMAFALPKLFRTTLFDAEYLLRSLFFIPMPLPGGTDWRPLFKLGWTLNYEMFFYALMALLFWCASMKQRAVALTLILGAFAGASFVLPAKSGILAFYANLNVLPFICGVWLAIWVATGLVRGREMRWALLALAALLTALFYQLPFALTKDLGGHALMTLTALFIVAAALCFEQALSRFGASKWIGDISYSLYLTHMFVLGIAWAVLGKLGIEPGTVLGGVGTVGMILASLVVADLSYRFFERPLLNLSRSRKAAPAAEPQPA